MPTGKAAPPQIASEIKPSYFERQSQAIENQVHIVDAKQVIEKSHLIKAEAKPQARI